MNYIGQKPSEGFFSPIAEFGADHSIQAAHVDAQSTGYENRRRQRLADRLGKSDDSSAHRWNHLITVVVDSAGDADALRHTLDSLLAQRYRNFEVLVAGVPALPSSTAEDFASCRGLFAEQAIDIANILTDPATDSLWRGSHLLFARAGTEFDPDALELLNAALDGMAHASIPAMVVCDYDHLSGLEYGSPRLLPGWEPDFVHSLDEIETAFLASRALLLAQRGPQQPRSLHDWLRGVATMTPAPQIVHIAETLVHIPQAQPSERSASGDQW